MHHPRSPMLLVGATLAGLLAVASLCGCQHQIVVPRQGFIPSDVPLTRAANDQTEATYRAPGFDASTYPSAVVNPARLFPAAMAEITPDEAVTIQQTMNKALIAAFGPNARLGPAEETPRTLVVDCAITELKPNRPFLNVAPQSQIRGRGYGYAGVEIYVRAGPEGPIVAAYMATANTQRLSLEKLTPLGTAEEATRVWAQGVANLVRER